MKQKNSFHDFLVDDWLIYLETRHHTEIQLGLARVKQIAERLNLLKFDAYIITVAGTNGKGSTIAALEAIYASAGYTVAAYTSPHLLCFNERIRLNQDNITDTALCNAFLSIHAVPDSQTLTYFEMVTLAALWYFKQNKPNIILLEVGMGGRLDATNCIDADLAIITTIDLDHQAFLGTTRDEIAIEKAGVFRPNQQAVYADINPPQTLLNKAKLHNLQLSMLHQDYDFEIHENKFIFSAPSRHTLTLQRPKIHPQAFAAAIMASIKGQDILPVSELAYQKAAKTAEISGRQQWLSHTSIPTLIDVAHNAQSVNLLAEYVREQAIEGKIHAVFSGLQDKTLYDLIAPMRAYVNTWYLTTINHARGATKSSLKTVCPRAEIFNEPRLAYTAAVNAAKPGDIIVVYGSFLLVSAVMSYLYSDLHEGATHELSN
ncbi:MAG: Mur ligase family protein [Legionella sp.]|nr:Mur ligase family protein [Legionella sp.]